MSIKEKYDLFQKYNNLGDTKKATEALASLKEIVKNVENKFHDKITKFDNTVSETTSPVNIEFSERKDNITSTPVDIKFSEKDNNITTTSPVNIEFSERNTETDTDKEVDKLMSNIDKALKNDKIENKTKNMTETDSDDILKGFNMDTENKTSTESEVENKIATETENKTSTESEVLKDVKESTETEVLKDIKESTETEALQNIDTEKENYDFNKASIVYISSSTCPACVQFQPIWNNVKKDLADAHYVFELDASSDIARKFNFEYTPAIYHLFKGFVNELYMKSVDDLKDKKISEKDYPSALRQQILKNS